MPPSGQPPGSPPAEPATGSRSAPLEEKLASALHRLEHASPFAKPGHLGPVLDLARRLLRDPDGMPALARLAPRFGPAGVFAGTDWEDPSTLLPGLVRHTFDSGEPGTVVLECLSELRLLALARGETRDGRASPEQARHLLTQILALNLGRLFGATGESDRVRLGPLGDAVSRLLRTLLEEIGFEDILESVLDEIDRILARRPVQVGAVKAMIAQIAVSRLHGESGDEAARARADALIGAAFGPSPASRDDPGLEAYRARLDAMDPEGRHAEADALAQAMHTTGLVSAYHAVLLEAARGAAGDAHEEIARALGLSPTGREALRRFPELVERLLEEAVHPETSQAAYGLARLLESGRLHAASLAPALWRQIHLELAPGPAETLAALFGPARPARQVLLAGVLELLGLPLGVAQGNNPTCQSARALAMWAHTDPAYLLHLLAQAAQRDAVRMPFEGEVLRSDALPPGLAPFHPLDTDPVSTLLVPHLDRAYVAMGRLCAGRGEDPHRWINPEFHGWWVGQDFAIAVDVRTGLLRDHEAFVRRFYRAYHPACNGENPLVHPQPAGLAVTDASGDFVGWHAIALLRAAPDPEGVLRLYFFDPNPENGRDWGGGVVVSTRGRGERFGEGSLPFAELASRLYLFHDDEALQTPSGEAPAEEVAQVMRMAVGSWASARVPA